MHLLFILLGFSSVFEIAIDVCAVLFFVCREKTQKSSGAVLCFSAKGYAEAPKRCASVPKGGRIFCFFCELTLLPGGGTIDKTDRRGSVWM